MIPPFFTEKDGIVALNTPIVTQWLTEELGPRIKKGVAILPEEQLALHDLACKLLLQVISDSMKPVMMEGSETIQ